MSTALEIKDFGELVQNNGKVNDVKFTIQDALTTPNGPQALGKMYTEIVQQVIEAESLGLRLVRKIRHDDIVGESTSFKWIGAGNIPNVERAESGEYPEFSIQMGKSATVRAQFLQRGLVVKITQEDIKYSRWDIIREHITQASLALSRAKEKLIFSVFEQAGVVIFDNTDTTSTKSIKGVANGRDRFGNKNGALTYEDLVDMVATMNSNGYNPNVVLVHPLSLPAFQKDPMLRHMGFVTGNPQAFLNSSKTAPNAYANGTVNTWRNQQRAATGNGQLLDEVEQSLLSTTTPDLPSFHPLSGMTVIASNLVPFDAAAKTTSIILLDTSATAILNEQTPLTVDSWDEYSREIVAVRIKESYSVDVIDEGRGIAVAKNIPLVPNELYVDPQVVIQAADLVK